MYKFPLGSVLNYRKTLEEECEKELSILKLKLLDEMTKYDYLNQSNKSLLTDLNHKSTQSITVSETILYTTFIDQLLKKMDIQNKLILQLKHDIDNKRDDLILAIKNRKSIEKLRDKGLLKYNKQITKKELDFMNEMASTRCKSSPEN